MTGTLIPPSKMNDSPAVPGRDCARPAFEVSLDGSASRLTGIAPNPADGFPSALLCRWRRRTCGAAAVVADPKPAEKTSSGFGIGRLAGLAVLGLLGLASAPGDGAARSIAPDAWFQRDFDTNYKLCAVRSNQPAWCSAWIDSIEAVRPKTNDITLPEWLRVPFGAYVLTCATLLPPTWCPEWLGAMKRLTELPEYTGPVNVLANQRIREEDAKAAAAQAWKDVLTRVVLNKVKSDDIELIKTHAKAGEVTALELLGWIYYDGRGVMKDYGLAYEYYGRAVLAGREDLRPILEKIWGLLNETQKLEINQMFR